MADWRGQNGLKFSSPLHYEILDGDPSSVYQLLKVLMHTPIDELSQKPNVAYHLSYSVTAAD